MGVLVPGPRFPSPGRRDKPLAAGACEGPLEDRHIDDLMALLPPLLRTLEALG